MRSVVAGDGPPMFCAPAVSLMRLHTPLPPPLMNNYGFGVARVTLTVTTAEQLFDVSDSPATASAHTR